MNSTADATIDSWRVPKPQPDSLVGGRARAHRALRNRILLYLSGFEIVEVVSLELAAECLRRTTTSEPAEAMRVLEHLLQERGVAIQSPTSRPRIHSYPPLNRRAMTSSRIETPTLYGSVRRMLRTVTGWIHKKR